MTRSMFSKNGSRLLARPCGSASSACAAFLKHRPYHVGEMVK